MFTGDIHGIDILVFVETVVGRINSFDKFHVSFNRTGFRYDFSGWFDTPVNNYQFTWNEVLRCLQLVQPTTIPDQDKFHSRLLCIFEEPHRLTEMK